MSPTTDRHEASSNTHENATSASAAGIVLIRREQEPERIFAGYLEEVLLAEGLVSYDVLVLRQGEPIRAEQFDSSQVLLLNTAQIDDDEATNLDNFVRNGGSLIAIRPPKALAAVCGLHFGGATTGNGYVIAEERHPLASGLCREPLQYHSQSDLCLIADADALAWLAVHPHRTTQHPAVTTRQHGQGRVAAFTYDLAHSTLTFHQGHSERVEPGPDGYSRPAYRYSGQVDPDRLALPQADLQQRFLTKLVQWVSEHNRPLPRLWYFPRRSMSAALFTGDSDGCSAEDIALIAETVERYGGTYTTYIKESDHKSLPPNFVQEIIERGHSFGPHIWCNHNPSPEEMYQAVKDQTRRYIERYGHQPTTHRGHCLIWVGWADMAEYLAEVGIAMDTNFVSAIVCGAGYMTGSGLPMRFMDESGRFIDCSEQPTQWEDDCHIEGTSFYSEGFSIPEAVAATQEMFDRSLSDFHTMINFNFHPIHVRTDLQTLTWIRESARYCHENGIPMLSGDAWVAFNKARRSATFADMHWDGSDFCFTVTSEQAASGLTVLLPSVLPRRRMIELVVDGESVNPVYELIDGDEHALCDLDFERGERKAVRCRFAP